MTSTNPLYFTPTEIWLQIFSHLEEPDYLNLKRASPYLRNVVDENASSICNNLILTRYPEAASILNTTLRDGWLVPAHDLVLTVEEKIDASFSRARLSSKSRAPRRSPSVVSTKVRTKLSEPGPQYLRFLIEYSLEIRIANDMFIDHPVKIWDESGRTPQQKFSSWMGLYVVQKFLYRLHKYAGAGFDSSFMDSGSRDKMQQGTRTGDGLAWFYT